MSTSLHQLQKLSKIQWSQIHKHKQIGDCWLVISNKVFDVSKYMLKHPGGRWIMLENSGKDATKAFQRTIHSEIAMEIMYQLYIGDLEDEIEKNKIIEIKKKDKYEQKKQFDKQAKMNLSQFKQEFNHE